jgi:hypothetical protein
LRSTFDRDGLCSICLFVGFFQCFLILRRGSTTPHRSPGLLDKIGRADSWATALTAFTLSYQNLRLTFGTRKVRMWVFAQSLPFVWTRSVICFVLSENLCNSGRLGFLFRLLLCFRIIRLNPTGISHKFWIKFVYAWNCLHNYFTYISM